LIVQVHTGHISLNARLHKIHKSETNKCPNCRDRRGNERARETVKHFLFECRAYQKEHHELLNTLKTDHPDLAEITNNLSSVKALLKFIAKTGRFKNYKNDAIGRNLKPKDR